MKYIFKKYCSNFVMIAQNEMNRLCKYFPDAQIKHFGSTSIPGVGGKGIIDMFLAVKREDIKDAMKILEKIGYEFKKNGGVENERWFFQQDVKEENEKNQRFHLHLTYIENEDMRQSINFRDYLRTHLVDAKEYEEIKHKAVEEVKKYQKKAYMNIKEPVIQKILGKMGK